MSAANQYSSGREMSKSYHAAVIKVQYERRERMELIVGRWVFYIAREYSVALL